MPVATSEEFVIARRYTAPRERVWQAWTEAERLKQWWGPKGFTLHTCKLDLRPGGVSRNPWNADWPLETLSTVLFAEHGAETIVTIQWRPHNATASERKTFAEGRDSMQQGWTGTLDQFAAHLSISRLAKRL